MQSSRPIWDSRGPKPCTLQGLSPSRPNTVKTGPSARPEILCFPSAETHLRPEQSFPWFWGEGTLPKPWSSRGSGPILGRCLANVIACSMCVLCLIPVRYMVSDSCSAPYSPASCILPCLLHAAQGRAAPGQTDCLREGARPSGQKRSAPRPPPPTQLLDDLGAWLG